MKKNKSKNAGLWLGVDDTNVPNNMYANHLSAAENYARSKGMNIVARYEVKHSDTAFLENPQVKRVVDDIKNGKIQALITPKLSMLGNRMIDLLNMWKILETYNVALISISEAVDTKNASWRLHFTMLASLAQFERELAAEVSNSESN